MKKTMLALVLGATAGTAAAQSNVTVYGIFDMAFVRESGGIATTNKLTSGVESGSRLGFKGSEDLGGGTSAIFLLENGFQGDTGTTGQGGLLFGRQAYVGLQSNSGTLLLGRQYTPQYLAVAAIDPFGSGTAGDTKNLMATTGNSASRMDNTVKYISPVVNGFSGEVVYGAGEVAGNNSAGRQLGGMLTYVTGDLTVRLASHYRNNDTATVQTSSARNSVLTALYDFGSFKAHFAYGVDKGVNSALPRNLANPFGYAVAPTPSTDSNVVLLGLTVPQGPGVWLASYIRKNDKTSYNQDAQQFAAGYRYYLSKRTDLYAVYAYIRNQNGAGYTVGSSIEGGTGNRALNLGIRHIF
ncbi:MULTISPECIES: porin [unclassified Janthinobacterium]|uniref:porin n=1 Tax=unclassified Janthinobacterium TaxID=2610881 RepID=UPI001612EEB8|nr:MULTISPECIES: porin [unclassified Janthinobacterium]MBB5370019.1 putative porin [Janthinobacterium sp. K2C7]MBB5382825.1 putative porin [Janthinobacterium sp. K2Li3]MBB5384810.1 putative porin [Janthinobacterium sp. K2E3]